MSQRPWLPRPVQKCCCVRVPPLCISPDVHASAVCRGLWQALALRQAVPQPQAEVRYMDRTVEVPDAALIRRLEAQLAEAEREHAELQRCHC